MGFARRVVSRHPARTCRLPSRPPPAPPRPRWCSTACRAWPPCWPVTPAPCAAGAAPGQARCRTAEGQAAPGQAAGLQVHQPRPRIPWPALLAYERGEAFDLASLPAPTLLPRPSWGPAPCPSGFPKRRGAAAAGGLRFFIAHPFHLSPPPMSIETADRRRVHAGLTQAEARRGARPLRRGHLQGHDRRRPAGSRTTTVLPTTATSWAGC